MDIKGYKFVNDSKVIGKWEFWDRIDAVDQFNDNLVSNKDSGYDFKTIYFLPQGQGYWIFEAWSKGKLYIHYGGDDPVLCFPYEIKQTEKEHSFLYLWKMKKVNILMF